MKISLNAPFLLKHQNIYYVYFAKGKLIRSCLYCQKSIMYVGGITRQCFKAILRLAEKAHLV